MHEIFNGLAFKLEGLDPQLEQEYIKVIKDLGGDVSDDAPYTLLDKETYERRKVELEDRDDVYDTLFILASIRADKALDIREFRIHSENYILCKECARKKKEAELLSLSNNREKIRNKLPSPKNQSNSNQQNKSSIVEDSDRETDMIEDSDNDTEDIRQAKSSEPLFSDESIDIDDKKRNDHGSKERERSRNSNGYAGNTSAESTGSKSGENHSEKENKIENKLKKNTSTPKKLKNHEESQTDSESENLLFKKKKKKPVLRIAMKARERKLVKEKTRHSDSDERSSSMSIENGIITGGSSKTETKKRKVQEERQTSDENEESDEQNVSMNDFKAKFSKEKGKSKKRKLYREAQNSDESQDAVDVSDSESIKNSSNAKRSPKTKNDAEKHLRRESRESDVFEDSDGMSVYKIAKGSLAVGHPKYNKLQKRRDDDRSANSDGEEILKPIKKEKIERFDTKTTVSEPKASTSKVNPFSSLLNNRANLQKGKGVVKKEKETVKEEEAKLTLTSSDDEDSVKVKTENEWLDPDDIPESSICKVVNCKLSRERHPKHGEFSRFMSELEKRIMLRYLIQNDAIRKCKGQAIYDKMHVDGFMLQRSIETLRNNMRRTILPQIRTFNLPKSIEKEFLNLEGDPRRKA